MTVNLSIRPDPDAPPATAPKDFQERHLYEACPLCDNPHLEMVGEARCSGHPLYDARLSPTLKWMTCTGCGHVFTDGYFTPDACDIVFSRTNDAQKVGYEIESNRLISARLIDRVLPFASDGVWLDIGFGNGSVLFTAQEYGFDPVGVDLRPDSVTALKSLGLEAYCEDVATLDLGRPCQVVSMLDVLEHMPFPAQALQAVHRMLAPGGVCVLSMPNSEHILWELLTSNNANPYWGELEHYHNFSRTRLYQLLEAQGFIPKRYGVSERYRACMEVIAVKPG